MAIYFVNGSPVITDDNINYGSGFYNINSQFRFITGAVASSVIQYLTASVSSATYAGNSASTKAGIVQNVSSITSASNKLKALQSILSDINSVSGVNAYLSNLMSLYIAAAAEIIINNDLQPYITGLKANIDSETSLACYFESLSKIIASSSSISNAELTFLNLLNQIVINVTSNTDIETELYPDYVKIYSTVDSISGVSCLCNEVINLISSCSSTSSSDIALKISDVLLRLQSDSTSLISIAIAYTETVKPVVLTKDGNLAELPNTGYVLNAGGVSIILTLAKLTPEGENGFMVIDNGIITQVIPAT